MRVRSIISTAFSGALLVSVAMIPFAASAKPPASTGAEVGGGVSDIRVSGNQRIENATVVSYLGIQPGSRVSQRDIDLGLKNLYATGFFADVKLERVGSALVVSVVENPAISKVAFEGNQRIETKDLEKELELKARSIYSRDKVQSDVSRILDIYRRSGRFNATVEPKIIQKDQNRVDLVYEITEGAVARIDKITFIGNEQFDSSTLQKSLRTEETRWYRFLSDNDKYDPDRLQFDQELLRRFYTSEGFADFQVKSANAELSPNKDAFYITFVVEEGPKYSLGDVKITNQIPDGREKIDFEPLLLTKKGDDYDSSKVESTVDAMTKELGSHGYAFVGVDPRLERDREKKVASLNYVIRPGPRVYVERINITGNTRTLDEVVRREFRLREGDAYNATKLQRSEQRINNLGFFEKVDVKNTQGSAPDKTVVNVDVKEKSTGEINIGAGYSTTDGILSNFGIAERNLLGRGQELKTDFILAARKKSAQLGFTEPYFLDRELAAGFDVYRTYNDFSRQSSYISDVTGLNLRAGYSLLEKLQHNIYYTVHRNTISKVPTTASLFIQQQAGTNTTSAIGHTFTYDERDNRFNPTKGYYASLTEEFAGLGGDSKYVRHEAKAAYYYSIVPKWVASVSGAGGYVFGLSEDVRINDRFFLGGDDFAGFQNAGLGPHDKVSRDALGGNKYYTGTVELRFPLGLPEELGVSGAAFSNVGSLWDSDDKGPSVADSSSIRASAGAGILWTSPFGPVRIDYSQAFRKESTDQTQNIRFSFGTKF